jgi:hypothetical protein
LTTRCLKVRVNVGIHSIVYCILSSIGHFFNIDNDDEKFPAHFTWKVAEKEFKMAFMMNKLAMINFCEIIHEK